MVIGDNRCIAAEAAAETQKQLAGPTSVRGYTRSTDRASLARIVLVRIWKIVKGYKREEVISQSNNSSYNKLCTMPVHSRHATTKHELTIPDEIVQRCPIPNDMMAAAQVL